MSEHIQLPEWTTCTPFERDLLQNLVEYKHESRVITKEMLIDRLWIEARNIASKNQSARIKALELLANMLGYTKESLTDGEVIDEETEIDESMVESTISKFNEVY